MTKDEDFKLLKIQTCVLRVNIHCEGCKQKVKKLLHRIEGVYQVSIDEERQKVTVSGSVDSANLIKRLVKGGKHAELWSQKSTQIQKQKDAHIKDDGKGNKQLGQKASVVKGLDSLTKTKQKFPLISEVEDDEFVGTDDEDDVSEFDEEEMQLVREKLNQLAMAEAANSAKKGIGAGISQGAINGAGKRGNLNQNNVIVKPNPNPGGIDQQKTLAALKMNNLQNVNNRSINSSSAPGEAKMANDINAVMNLAGFHGNGEGFPGNGFTAGRNPAASMMNMDGHPAQYNHQMMMNRQQQQQQPQVVAYNRSPLIPPTTEYYYDYGHVLPCPGYNSGGGDHHSTAASDVFSDENPNLCSVM